MADDENARLESANARKALRRFYLVYGQMTEEKTKEVHDCLFGDGFTNYMELITKPNLPEAHKRPVRDAIFDALYVRNTGFLPQNNGNNMIPFTLHRNDGVFQSVMLVVGDAQKKNFSIRQEPVHSSFEDEKDLCKVILKFKDEEFELSLPLLLYFMELKNGAVTSACNPALTHNLMRLETKLNDTFEKQNDDETEITLLLNTTEGPQVSTIYVADGQIDID